ncbi:MAG TPA: Coenzyme F420 hydrogenase/dehydrogenase, beta subunit C-terminal domain [Candidatus Lokiarchaeia archaeon]|nr:Coenzyme F420 hydrogenase/dehydrogenase, beta subunit C-terminal domain [Candidatus Lokiarchaeia archaeon]
MSEEVQPKSFEDLIKDVHEKGLCGECGGCVSFCSASELKAIEMSETGPPRYINKDNCLHCGICYLICPQTDVMNEELNAKFDYKPPIGNWVKVASSKAVSSDIVAKATDGGTVTALLVYLLDHNLIDGAIVSMRIGPFMRIPFFAKTREELIEASGSHFTMAGQLGELEKYSTFIPTISELKVILKSDMMNIAMVGTPCQIHSLRKMQDLRILPSHVVKYTLGLFCNENFCFDEDSRKKIEEKFGFSFENVEKMNIRDEIMIYLKDQGPINLTFDELKEFARPACSFCNDYSNVYADIAFGGIGSADGYTTTLIRTSIGQKIYQDAIQNGYILEPVDQNSGIKKSKMIAKIMSFSQEKRQRAESSRRSDA